MSIFRYACGTDGCLFLGSSELADADLFEAVDARHRVYRARGRARATAPGLSEAAPRRVASPRPIGERPAAAPPTPSELHADALEAFAPPTVLLDDRWNVLHLSSNASRFFQQSADRWRSARPTSCDSSFATLCTRCCSRRSTRSRRRCRRSRWSAFDDTARRVAMLAQPRPAPKGSREVLLTFLDLGEFVAPGAGYRPGGRGRRAAGARGSAMPSSASRTCAKSILSTTRSCAPRTKSCRASNEEYRSTTEELETSKEELQSTNEELQTVNHELKLKLDELSRARTAISRT